ncbi:HYPOTHETICAL PROTEIN MCJ_005020 [Mesomycoplasma conjunctivae]|uniref:Uncharacterized protein n=1 Tax=Mesomycoplasma conjunctivae (strain ATCC 25834 / NCTC 10147 / HRC/581) TaxID=572263 RepID=C5J6U4_MESCH|nr:HYPOTHETICAL PROTEIN MCJ_005020 [Mesomycoplasma conjunctivae]
MTKLISLPIPIFVNNGLKLLKIPTARTLFFTKSIKYLLIGAFETNQVLGVRKAKHLANSQAANIK